jgi:hypothetical protein
VSLVEVSLSTVIELKLFHLRTLAIAEIFDGKLAFVKQP